MRIVAHGNRIASLGQSIVVEVSEGPTGSVTLQAPFYRQSIALTDIVDVSVHDDDGTNRGLLNWFVTGQSGSPEGVRLNTGGKARVDIVTRDAQRYGIVVDDMTQAQQIVEATRAHAGEPHVR